MKTNSEIGNHKPPTILLFYIMNNNISIKFNRRLCLYALLTDLHNIYLYTIIYTYMATYIMHSRWVMTTSKYHLTKSVGIKCVWNIFFIILNYNTFNAYSHKFCNKKFKWPYSTIILYLYLSLSTYLYNFIIN